MRAFQGGGGWTAAGSWRAGAASRLCEQPQCGDDQAGDGEHAPREIGAELGETGFELVRRDVLAVFGRFADAGGDGVRMLAADSGVGQLPGDGEGIEAHDDSLDGGRSIAAGGASGMHNQHYRSCLRFEHGSVGVVG